MDLYQLKEDYASSRRKLEKAEQLLLIPVVGLIIVFAKVLIWGLGIFSFLLIVAGVYYGIKFYNEYQKAKKEKAYYASHVMDYYGRVGDGDEIYAERELLVQQIREYIDILSYNDVKARKNEPRYKDMLLIKQGKCGFDNFDFEAIKHIAEIC